MSVQNNSIKYNIDYIKDVLNTKILVIFHILEKELQ